MLTYQKLLDARKATEKKNPETEKEIASKKDNPETKKKSQTEADIAEVIAKTKTVSESVPASFKKSLEKAEIETAAIVLIVDKMIALEELFRLSMDESSELYSFLQTNQTHQETMLRFSFGLQKTLPEKKGAIPEIEIFKQAFLDLLPSNGNSMLLYLKKNTRLFQFLASFNPDQNPYQSNSSVKQRIDTLYAVYESFCAYRKKDIINQEQEDVMSVEEAEKLMRQLSVSAEKKKSKP